MASSTTPQATKAMAKLSLNPTSSVATPSSSKPRPKPKKQVVADSWEDDESSASEAEAEPPTPSAQPSNMTQDGVAAPPPTPISPSYGSHGHDADVGNNAPWLATSSSAGGSYTYRDARGDDGPRRQEKTDAVARRMIASALGMRAPKPTEEQRAYDRAVREKERKKREEERRVERIREEEAQKAKAAIWND